MADHDKANRNPMIHFRVVGLSSEHLERLRAALGDRTVQASERKRPGVQGAVVAIEPA